MKKFAGGLIAALILVITFTIPSSTLGAEKEPEHFKTREQCLACHGQTGYSIVKDEKNIPLYIDKGVLGASVHGEFNCEVCHATLSEGIYGKELQTKVSTRCASCHTGAAFDVKRGVHQGTANVPNCVTCHGSHAITAVKDSGSAVAGANIAKSCALECHGTQYAQFTESFHGKAVALGGQNAPSCVSCHGAHRILGKDNPAAKTNQSNKYLLCAGCHGGGNLGTGTDEHYALKSSGYSAPMYWVKTKMPWLIIVVMTVFLLHVILDLAYRIRQNLPQRRGLKHGGKNTNV